MAKRSYSSFPCTAKTYMKCTHGKKGTQKFHYSQCLRLRVNLLGIAEEFWGLCFSSADHLLSTEGSYSVSFLSFQSRSWEYPHFLPFSLWILYWQMLVYLDFLYLQKQKHSMIDLQNKFNCSCTYRNRNIQWSIGRTNSTA